MNGASYGDGWLSFASYTFVNSLINVILPRHEGKGGLIPAHSGLLTCLFLVRYENVLLFIFIFSILLS